METRKASSHRYQFISQTLRDRLRDGIWVPGVRLPTLRRLAHQFDVSTNTVRNAIRVLEQEGSLYRVHGVGTFVRPVCPTRSDSGLKQQKEATLALVMADLGDAMETSVARGVEQACRGRAWRMQVYDSRHDARLEIENLSGLPQSGACGAIIFPTCCAATIEPLFRLKLGGFPFVLVDRSIRGLQVDVVESDHEQGAYLATLHLIEQGHRRILMLTDPPVLSSVEARIRGYERALLDNGLTPQAEWKIWPTSPVTEDDLEKGQRWIRAYEAAVPGLRRIEPPVAMFAYNAHGGWGAVEACRAVGLRIPEDVSVVCFDDTEITRALSPPITTIAQQPVQIGRKAVELLERRLQFADAEPQHVCLEVSLIKRQSVLTVGRGLATATLAGSP